VAVLFATLLLVGLIWANLFYVGLNPTQGTFLPRWLGTRLFMVKGLSPYSQEVTTAIQSAQQAGGQSPAPGASFFLYPFYTFVAYAPFALTANQAAARVAWMTILEIASFATLVLSINLCRWRVSVWIMVLLFIFTIAWYYGVLPIAEGDLSVLAALCVVIALIAIREGQDPLAGFLLALAMGKPVPVLLMTLFILIWAVSHQRWTLIWGFLGSLGLILAAASLLIPDWVLQNIRQVIQYIRLPLANTPGTLVAYWLPGIGKQLGWLLIIVIGIVLVVEWIQALRKDFRWFYWTACLTLAVTPLVGLPTSLNNFIVIFPALILVLATWDERWGVVGRVMVLVSMAILSVGAWWLVIAGNQAGMPPDKNPWIFFLLPVFMIIGTYWVRWWAIRPPRLPVVEMAAQL